MSLRIVAVDPGKTTGVCLVDFGGWRTWSGPALDAVEMVEDFVNQSITDETIVAVERFTFTTTKHTAQYDAIEVIGALRYVAAHAGIEFEMQSRADRTRVTNDVVRRFVRPKNDHEMDAAKHAVLAAVRHQVVTVW